MVIYPVIRKLERFKLFVTSELELILTFQFLSQKADSIPLFPISVCTLHTENAFPLTDIFHECVFKCCIHVEEHIQMKFQFLSFLFFSSLFR